jgi:hypothetical protein
MRINERTYNLLTILVVTLLLGSGCAHVYRSAPVLQNPNEYADIFVIRNKSIVGGGLGIGATYDGYKMASVSIGHYVHFRVDPGSHAIGAMAGGITLNFERQKRYFFLIGIGTSGDQNIERIDEVHGESLLAASKEIPLK